MVAEFAALKLAAKDWITAHITIAQAVEVKYWKICAETADQRSFYCGGATTRFHPPWHGLPALILTRSPRFTHETVTTTSPYSIQGLKARPITAIHPWVSRRNVTEFDHRSQTP